MPTRAENKSFMFTGRISVTRRVAQDAVRTAGGIVGASVCSTTDYLVVGDKPGSKLEKADYWDVPTITEVEFWQMLEEYEEELEPEEWDENGIKVLSESAFLLLLDLCELKQAEDKRKKEEEERRKYKEKWSPKSWEDPMVLFYLLARYPYDKEVVGLVPLECPHCSWVIPYTTHSYYYYCFNCHCYTDAKYHNCMYIPHPTLPDYEHGSWKICTLCENVKFFSSAEFDDLAEHYRTVDIHNSAEFALPIHQNCRTKHRSQRTGRQILQTKSDSQIEQLYRQWLLHEDKKVQRRQEKIKKRYAT